MDFIFKITLSVGLIFLPTWYLQEQAYYWDYLRQTLKDNNNIAVHDAMITAIEKYELANGYIIIDNEIALQELEKSLQRNFKLNADLSPSAYSALQNEIKILHFEVLDDSNTNFPLLYENPTYNIVQYITSPSIIAVIKTNINSLNLSFKQLNDVQAASIYQYKAYY